MMPRRETGSTPPSHGPSRRSVLTGTAIAATAGLLAATALIEDGVLPGRIALARAVGQAGRPGRVPAVRPGSIVRGQFSSAARDGTLTNWVIAYPPGSDPSTATATSTTSTGARLPVCVVLHGRGVSAEAMVTIGYPNFLAAAVAAGLPPFALAAVDGGDHYWHARRTGGDPGRMVLTEWLPRLAAAGLAARPADRIALLGWSMGGYGALLLASQLGAARVAVIAAESPALWLSPGDAAAGAFDGARDFRAHDVFARRDVLGRIPIRIDCGTADPFQPADRRFASGLHPAAVTDFGSGDHTDGYWRAKAAKTIEFVGNHLTSG